MQLLNLCILVSIILRRKHDRARSECGPDHIRPSTRCGQESLGSLERPPSRLSTHRLPPSLGSGIWWEDRGRRAHKCLSHHGISQQYEKGILNIFHTPPPWLSHLRKEKATTVSSISSYGRKVSRSREHESAEPGCWFSRKTTKNTRCGDGTGGSCWHRTSFPGFQALGETHLGDKLSASRKSKCSKQSHSGILKQHSKPDNPLLSAGRMLKWSKLNLSQTH